MEYNKYQFWLATFVIVFDTDKDSQLPRIAQGQRLCKSEAFGNDWARSQIQGWLANGDRTEYVLAKETRVTRKVVEDYELEEYGYESEYVVGLRITHTYEVEVKVKAEDEGDAEYKATANFEDGQYENEYDIGTPDDTEVEVEQIYEDVF